MLQVQNNNQYTQFSAARRLRNETLTAAHAQEWLDSTVDPEVIRLNVVSLSTTEPFDVLFYSDALPRRNDGRLRDHLLMSYQHVEQGGWWCASLDPETGELSLWGCFKPDHPRKTKKKGFGSPQESKFIKYEHPPKVPTELFCLKVSLSIWEKVAERSGVPLPETIEICPLTGEAKGFWPWVIAQNVSLTITEGAKKAGALLTAGYAAVGLPGIFNGYRQPKDSQGHKFGLPHLIPQLTAFCQPGRQVNFCFDNDSKPVTKFNVRQAIAKTGGLLEAKDCQVSVLTWDYPEKGIDDLITIWGADALHALYENRQPLAQFNLGLLLSFTPEDVNLTVNQRYLSVSLPIPPESQLIGLKSAKNTGKTEFLAQRVEKALAAGQPVLVLTHRQQLAKELGERMGVEYRTELTEYGKIAGYALCIDSLHSHANPPFNPDHWTGALVIIDEAEQVIWHLLNSATCQYTRAAILETFQRLLQNTVATGGQIYLSDADLSPIAVDEVQKATDLPVKTWIVENKFIPNQGKRTVYNYLSPEALLSDVFAALSAGESVIIHTSAQKAKSRWGSINLEAVIALTFPDRKILRIDSETIEDSQHLAYHCSGNLNTILKQYDVVIASPTIETGVSIDVKHFQRVFCFALGVQTVDAVCQALERVRDDVPRHLYTPQRSRQRVGNGAISVKALLRSQHQQFRANQTLLSTADEIGSLDGERPQHLLTWTKRACVVNAGFQGYRASILAKLEAEGYEQVTVDSEQSAVHSEGNLIADDCTLLTDLIKATAEANHAEYCEKVAATENPDELEYQKLTEKRAKTEFERLKQRKGELSRRYLTLEVTPQMVKRDDEGWLAKLQLHYYLTKGRKFLPERDRARLLKLGEMVNGKVFSPDANRACLSLKIRTLEILNIQQFLDPQREWTKYDLQDWLSQLVNWRWDIKTILGMGINPEQDSAIGVAQRLLGLLGLKMVCTGQRRVNGRRERFYRFLPPSDGREEVFARWLQRDCHTPFVSNLFVEKVTAA